MSSGASKQATRTRRWIFGALLRLLGRKPYTEIKIANIAEEAGVARQSFYRNFKDKDDIVGKYVELLFDRCLETAQSETGNDELARGQALDRFFSLLYQDRDPLLRLKNAGLSHLILGALHRRAAGKLVHGTVDDPYRRCLLEYQLGGLASATVEWINRDMDIPPAQMGAYLRKITAPFTGEALLSTLLSAQRQESWE